MTKGFYIILFFATILFAESCKNNDNVLPTIVYSWLNVVNASPDTLNFYLNGTRQNNGSDLFPVSQSLYDSIPDGSQNIQFKKAGTFNVLFSVPLKLKDSTNYSLYVTSGAASGAFTSIDSLYADSSFKVSELTKIRFANASPNAGNLDVYVGDTLNFKSRAFKTSSVFLLTGAGTKTVKIYQSGTTTALVDTNIVFNPAYIYTLYSKGQLNGKGASVFDVGVAINYIP
jgi:hypothetical protein